MRISAQRVQRWIGSALSSAALTLVVSSARAEPGSTPARERSAGREAGWIAVGSGAVVLSGGIASLLLANLQNGELRDARRSGEPRSEIDSRRQAVDSYNLAGTILTGVGLAAVGTGITVLVLNPKNESSEATRVGLVVVGNRFAVQGSF